VDLQRNKTSLHIVTSVGYSIEYYDARNNKYQVLDTVLINRRIFQSSEIRYHTDCTISKMVTASNFRVITILLFP
jgi:hypothetical protein